MNISQRSIVLLSLPFSDIKTSKVRPAIVLSKTTYNKRHQDFIAVPLTTNLKKGKHDLLLKDADLEEGYLIADSKIKVDRIFSVRNDLVRMKIGKINNEAHNKIKKMLVDLID